MKKISMGLKNRLRSYKNNENHKKPKRATETPEKKPSNSKTRNECRKQKSKQTPPKQAEQPTAAAGVLVAADPLGGVLLQQALDEVLHLQVQPGGVGDLLHQGVLVPALVEQALGRA